GQPVDPLGHVDEGPAVAPHAPPEAVERADDLIGPLQERLGAILRRLEDGGVVEADGRAQGRAPAADDLGHGGNRRLPAGQAGASHGTSSVRTPKRRARTPTMTAYRCDEREVAGPRR